MEENITKPLDQMSPEELGKLFPIIISDPNPAWPEIFQFEKKLIEDKLNLQNIISIEHIGSTSIPNLKAKPTVDILLVVPCTTDTVFLSTAFKDLDYHINLRPDNPPPHITFVKGYTPEGYKGQSYHVHVRYETDCDELYFRDYLRTHPETGRQYEELKLRLADEHRYDRDGYTDAKSDFVTRVTEKARYCLDKLYLKL